MTIHRELAPTQAPPRLDMAKIRAELAYRNIERRALVAVSRLSQSSVSHYLREDHQPGAAVAWALWRALRALGISEQEVTSDE